ncbi:MAG TPA: metal ABC transporter permease [bacterium]|nr:metal ABC transporter permease [bacterium]
MDDSLSSLAVSIAVGAVGGYLGSLMISKRMALAGDALGHVALPGLGLGLAFHFDPSLGAFLFVLLGILLVWQLGGKTSLGMETLIGIAFVTSLAIGFLIVPEPELLESLIGDVSKVSPPAAVFSILISLGVFLLVRSIYPGMMLLNISEDLAHVQGITGRKYNLLYLLAIAAVVSLGVKVTGTLLVGALMIIPAAASRNVSRNLRQYAYGSLFIGASSCAIGLSVHRQTGFPAGPSMILVNAFLFGLSLLLKKTIARAGA